ncbi:MAG: response regulator [Candidatus Sulfotelmatobacter sp.]
MNSAILPLLLIEDETGVTAYVRTALERRGYTVVCSDSGADGLRLLASREFLGVVSDMRMPGGVDGAQVSRLGIAASSRAGVAICFHDR